ncbi:MAG: CARDB domain-containing protein [Chloroflexota bacterium]|nr:CARDB domain-containing protein [Chloroflexota bacterium]
MRQSKLLKLFVLPLIVAFLLAAPILELYPAKILGAQGLSVYVRIEGQDNTIWRGQVTVSTSDITADNSGEPYHFSHPTALGALDEASQSGGFPYYVTDKYGALFVESIGGEENKGANGWTYRVDYYNPNVAAGRFILSETVPPDVPHREILWSYGSGSTSPLKILLSDTEIDAGDEFRAVVSMYSDDTHNWSPCRGATVHVNHHSYVTGADGTVDISIDREGIYEVFAEKDTYICSDKTEIMVTAPRLVRHNLTLKINPAGGGTVNLMPRQPAGGYLEDSEVELTAIPAASCVFIGWSGNLSGNTNPTTILMSRNRKVTANFILFDTGNLTTIELVEIDSYVTSVSVGSYPAGDLANIPTDLDLQAAYVVGSEGSGSFTLRFTDISNAGDMKLYKVIDSGWTEFEDMITTDDTVELTMEIGSTIIVFALPVQKEPASFSASQLDISPDTVQPDQQVDISIDIANNGGKVGSYEAILYINGQIEDSQTVSIPPGSTDSVVFSITRATPGTYTVSLGEEAGQFIVVGSQSSDGGLDSTSKIVIGVIATLVSALAFLLRRILGQRHN